MGHYVKDNTKLDYLHNIDLIKKQQFKSGLVNNQPALATV